jgi:phosphatidylglycerophosphatase GEP4
MSYVVGICVGESEAITNLKYKSTLEELNYTALREYVDVVIFDKDNTLTGPYENEIHPLASSGLTSALDVFGRDRIAILSNSAGTLDDTDYHDALEIEEALGIRVIRHDEKKPGGLDEVLKHFDLDDAAKICMVGDRILTDIVFGNLHGMLTVHTLPLCQGEENSKDNWISAKIRWAENTLLYAHPPRSQRYQDCKLEHKYWPGDQQAPLHRILPNESSENETHDDA